MRAKDRDESAADREKRLNRSWFWLVPLVGLLAFGYGLYAMLSLLFGTREHGTVGDCTEHVTIDGRVERTSYRCDVQLTNGSTTTVNFASSPSFGDHVSLTMWDGHVVEVGNATRQSWVSSRAGSF